jgi:hypothetical protein
VEGWVRVQGLVRVEDVGAVDVVVVVAVGALVVGVVEGEEGVVAVVEEDVVEGGVNCRHVTSG